MSTSNTAGTGAGAGAGGRAGSGIGSKIKGAIQVVHGVGDSIRGTVLGGVDTVAGDTSSAGAADNIATRGRAEVDQGMANLRGRGGNAASVAQTSPTHTAPSVGTSVGGTGTFGGIGPTGTGTRTGALGHTTGSGAGAGAGVVGSGNQTTQVAPVEQQGSAGGVI
ncbi:hypothetical protein FIBSPDRAFT_1048852 [Athelia psychrophila]|uniref:Uncharacterized protein n=1 Tax=Athelia psychrophila TaxID=1759441 RepID=A0A166D4N2_9AGAM|nr:hypothetical protein FIBSPDRAFT_1048852 [Fibularhizoctonia sp. CBS 109695]